MGHSADVDAGAGFIWKRGLKASASLSSDGTETNRLVQLICIEKFTDVFCEHICLTYRRRPDTAAAGLAPNLPDNPPYAQGHPLSVEILEMSLTA
jgi:hypothetical protein